MHSWKTSSRNQSSCLMPFVSCFRTKRWSCHVRDNSLLQILAHLSFLPWPVTLNITDPSLGRNHNLLPPPLPPLPYHPYQYTSEVQRVNLWLCIANNFPENLSFVIYSFTLQRFLERCYVPGAVAAVNKIEKAALVKLYYVGAKQISIRERCHEEDDYKVMKWVCVYMEWSGKA